MHRFLLAWLLFLVVLSGCGGGSDVPPELSALTSASALQAQPPMVELEGVPVVLTGTAVLNRMPMSGGRLAFNVSLVPGPTALGPLPEGIRVLRIAAVNGSEVWWKYQFAQSRVSPTELSISATEGPFWGSDVIINVIVSLVDAQGAIHHVRLTTTVLAVY